MIANLVVFIVCSVSGVIVIGVAGVLTGVPRYESVFLPWLKTGFEGFSWLTALGLAVIGFIAGRVKPALWRLWGIAAVSLLPVWAVAEMRLDPSSHNLWPIEFIFFALVALPGTAGSYAGKRLR